MIQLLDIKIDVIFKDFFGSKTHKEVLESFINSCETVHATVREELISGLLRLKPESQPTLPKK